MRQPGTCRKAAGSGPLPRWGTRILMATMVILASLIDTNLAAASEATAGLPPIPDFPLTQIFTFLFLMLGPFKIIGPFSAITKGADAGVARQIAVQATLFASAALLVAALLGESILNSYHIPLPVLALSAGIILFLVALQNILQQFTQHTSTGEAAPDVQPTPVMMAMTPLAFPTIVTPYGIAALVVFLALAPSLDSKLLIGAIVAVIMALNLIVMLTARYSLPALSLLLPILGAVLGIVQVALGLQIINNSLRALGIL